MTALTCEITRLITFTTSQTSLLVQAPQSTPVAARYIAGPVGPPYAPHRSANPCLGSSASCNRHVPHDRRGKGENYPACRDPTPYEKRCCTSQ